MSADKKRPQANQDDNLGSARRSPGRKDREPAMTSLPLGDIDSALHAAESAGVQSALAKLFLAEYRRHPERGMDAAVSRVLSRAKPKETRARATAKQPERSSADYTPEQERCLDGLARIVADVLRRQLDEERPDLARRTGRLP